MTFVPARTLDDVLKVALPGVIGGVATATPAAASGPAAAAAATGSL